MVKKHLTFQPLSLSEQRLKVRDALPWKQHALVEGSQNILGVLAGLNRLYYTTLQFKPMGAFIEEMTWKPKSLQRRLATFFTDPEAAIETYKGLVSETVHLVEGRMPEIDTSTVRDRLGRTESRWEPVAMEVGNAN